MDRFTKSIIAAVAIITLLLGMQFTSSHDTNEASDYSLPANSDTSSRSAENIPIRTLADFNNAIVNIADRTNPTVVTITTEMTVRQQVRSPFEFFFLIREISSVNVRLLVWDRELLWIPVKDTSSRITM